METSWEWTVQIICVKNWFKIGICSDVTTNLLIFVKREEINEKKKKYSSWVAKKVLFLELLVNWKIKLKTCLFHSTI